LKDELSNLHNKMNEATANHEDVVHKLKDELVKITADH
jgi:hypothetical protein